MENPAMPTKSFTLTVSYDHKTGTMSVDYNDNSDTEYYDVKTLEDIDNALSGCVYAAASPEDD